MKRRPPIGHLGEHQFTVTAEHCIDFADAGMPAVFSTPKLIGLLERTARFSVAPFLENHERTVGVEIDLKHLAPTPLGAKVTLSTRVIGIEGSYLTFAVEARDESELISKGIHKRAVIEVESFTRRVARKSNPS
jgi:fluoroacetyl-CoA thioesterase